MAEERALQILIREVKLTKEEEEEISEEAKLAKEAYSFIEAATPTISKFLGSPEEYTLKEMTKNINEAVRKLKQLIEKQQDLGATAKRVWTLLILLKREKKSPLTRINPKIFLDIYNQEMKTKRFIGKIRSEIIRTTALAERLRSIYPELRTLKKQCYEMRRDPTEIPENIAQKGEEYDEMKHSTAKHIVKLKRRVEDIIEHLTTLYRLEQVIERLLIQETILVREVEEKIELVRPAVRPVPRAPVKGPESPA